MYGLKHQKEKRSMEHFAGLDVSAACGGSATCAAGPPLRSFAADAHDCIMVGSSDLPDTRLWRD